MAQVILISIYPEHAANIISGKKQFEYRKTIPAKKISHLVLYCTEPVKKIIAVAEILDCFNGAPSRIWDLTSHGSGITRSTYRDYFKGCRKANAFSLGSIYEMKRPIGLDEVLGQRNPPQSFYYLDEDEVKMIFKERKIQPVVLRSQNIEVKDK